MSHNKAEDTIVRKKYSPQFKDLAVERAAIEGVAQVAKDLGMKESMLYSWRAQKNKAVIQLRIKSYSKPKFLD